MTLNNRIKMMQDNQEQFIVEMKETQKQQKQVEYIKTELDGLLWADMMEHNNIFDDEIRSIIIDDCMSTTDVLLYNRDYTRQYLNKRYYTIARQVEQIKKKTEATNKPDYKERIAIEKWDLQRQKELLKIKQLKQKTAQNEQKYNAKQPSKRVYAKKKRKRWRNCKSVVVLNVCTDCNIGAYNIRVYKCSSKNKIKGG